MKAIVVGGGAAGCGAAWRLRELGHEVTLLEKETDLGGRCRTFFWANEWQIRGAFAFVGSEDNLIEQSKKLGIYSQESLDDLTDIHAMYLWHKRKAPVLQESLAPKDILASPLLGWKEKASLAKMVPAIALQVTRNDPRDITSAAHLDTETAYDYAASMSQNFADYILEPTMQMFCGYEKADYSKAWLVWLMAGFQWAGNWWSFKDRGVGNLTYAFEQHFKADAETDLKLGVTVKEVLHSDEGVTVQFLEEGEEKSVSGDFVVMAVPAPLVSPLMPNLPAEHAGFLKSVGYVGHHIAYFQVECAERDMPESLLLPTADGFTRVSNMRFMHKGGDKFLVTGELKGNYCAATLGQPAEQILAGVWEEFEQVDARAKNCKIVDSYLQRNDLAICRRETGFVKRLKAFKELPSIQRVAFAGDYMINSTVGQAHWSGLQAADALHQRNA